MRLLFEKGVNTIHLDMDGVLADFDKFILDNMGRTFSHADGPAADLEMWDFLAGVDHLYLNLEPTPYAFELFNLANDLSEGKVEILTAIPRRKTVPQAEQDKRDWIEKYFGGHIHVKMGPYSRDKWNHAKPGDILVDDRFDNITDWINHGCGIGVHHDHSNPAATYESLKRLIPNER